MGGCTGNSDKITSQKRVCNLAWMGKVSYWNVCVGEGVECKPTVKRNKMYFWTRIKLKVAATDWVFEDMLISATCRLVRIFWI